MQFNTQEQHFKETFEQKIQLKYTYTHTQKKKLTNNTFQRTDCHQDESLQKRNPNEDESFAEEKSR